MKKKIGLLIPNLHSGGAERVVALTSELLHNKGYDVYIFVFDSSGISYKYKGTIVNMKTKAEKNLLAKILIRIVRILKFSFYIFFYKLDIVISFLNAANIVNYYSFGKVKKIIACRGYNDYLKNGKKYALMLNKVDNLIVQSKRMKTEFSNKYNTDFEKINVIYNPFDLLSLENDSKEMIIDDRFKLFANTHILIGTVGSFKNDKGFWNLIKVFNIVKKSIPNVGLVIIGHKGEMEEKIKLMVNTSKINNDVLFLGYQEGPVKFMREFSLYVCTSLYEGFPNAIVETMAVGVPVISTDCKTGPREILNISKELPEILSTSVYCDFGVLVPNFSLEADFNLLNLDVNHTIMSNEIIKLLENDKLRNYYSNQSLKRSKDFNGNNYLNKLEELF